MLNPTLQIRTVASGQTRPLLAYLTRCQGPVQRSIPTPLANALAAILAGANPDDLLEQDVLDWLVRNEIWLPGSPDPLPRYRPELPFTTIGNRPRSVVVNADTETRYDQDGCLLARRESWGVGATYWLNEAERSRWAEWLGVHPPTSWLDIDQRLLAVGGLISSESEWRLHAEAMLSAWQKDYAARRYVVVSPLLDEAELRALRAYADARRQRGYLDGDFGTAGRNRSNVYDDRELRPLHERLAAFASAVTQTQLVASYSFLAYYHGGGGLPPHRDKSNCQVSISLAVASGTHAETWPLLLGEPPCTTEVRWQEGQALVFEGRELSHSRPPLDATAEATYLILHFQRDPEYS